MAHDEVMVSNRSSNSTLSSVSSPIEFKGSDANDSNLSLSALPSLPSLDPPPPQPTIRLLFSLLPTRTWLIVILPAIFFSIVAGCVAPFMTYLVGKVFNSFSAYPMKDASQADKAALIRGVGFASLELLALAGAALVVAAITSHLWILTGEYNVSAVRETVYDAVTKKDMVWFDAKMGTEGNVQSADKGGPLGAAGLMSKFARETDEVRAASAIASGALLQYITTIITCLALAFARSPLLTIVILSSLPVLILIQAFSQAIIAPAQAFDRKQAAVVSTIIDRAVDAIATVKAFNAQEAELASASSVLTIIDKVNRTLNGVWAAASAASQFVTFAMFVSGFWFGAKLIRSGKASTGDVMAVFWACMIACTHLQMCIPQLIILTRGKFAIASLLTLCQSPTPQPQTTTRKDKRSKRPVNALRKIHPPKCEGEISMHSVSFSYPTRPNIRVLKDVSLFLAAHEMTFIVGGSGSGKSTIAALLLRLYTPTNGQICFDDQDIEYLDDKWMKEHLAGVSQECTLFDGSVHQNVAMALDRPVSEGEMVEACRAALVHDFVRDLPDGYDTQLGNGGAALSGGQRQRLAIARARLRNPSILILDEATSALDSTSRILVFEALRYWRRDKTTVVITHDLSQINPQDFLYVLHNGEMAEQGFRADLESGNGHFREMVESQGLTGGYLPEKDLDRDREDSVEDLGQILETEYQRSDDHSQSPNYLARPITPGNWMIDAVAELTQPNLMSVKEQEMERVKKAHRTSISPSHPHRQSQSPPPSYIRKRRPSSLQVDVKNLQLAFPERSLAADYIAHHRRSLQFTPTSPTIGESKQHLAYGNFGALSPCEPLVKDDDGTFDLEKNWLSQKGLTASEIRGEKRDRKRWDQSELKNVKILSPANTNEEEKAQPQPKQEGSFGELCFDLFPTIPHKFLLFLGLVLTVCSAAMTPLFSYFLSRLLFEVSTGAGRVAIINKFGIIVLSVAAADAALFGLRWFVMQLQSSTWINTIRKSILKRVLAQDKKWFDKTEHSASAIVQTLIKDGDDARNLLGMVLMQAVLVISMLSIGLIWALVRGWQLTLVGLGIAPVFAIAMSVQNNLMSKCELRNKRARDDVSKQYYEAISNVRGIRSMGLENVFRAQFSKASNLAMKTGARGAIVEGFSYGLSNALIYLAEALLFWAGAVLIVKGTYTYLQMVEVLNLVVFTISIASQFMTFTGMIAKSVQAARDFNRLIKLPLASDESKGCFRPPIAGAITFHHVSFSYPERSDIQVLKDVSLDIGDGECVAIVGASGSGKSTIAALLQRLYEPDVGTISIGTTELKAMDIKYLRNNVSVVSQRAMLFDATIRENIAYGNPNLTDAEVQEAAKAANVHEFITSLPQGYETKVGENASQISGGQAQRVQIARALARPSRILILDECTSALDSENQGAIMDAIRRARNGRTTIMVTHKLPIMRMCDRILVVHEGSFVESGTYDELVASGGVFANLANGGEWIGD